MWVNIYINVVIFICKYVNIYDFINMYIIYIKIYINLLYIYVKFINIGIWICI